MTGAISVVAGVRTPSISLTGVTLSDIGDSGPQARAYYELNLDGSVQTFTNPDGEIEIGDWINPRSIMGSFEARATITGTIGGGTLTGTTGSYLNLGTSRRWTLVSSTPSLFCSRTLTIEIRDVATSTVRATATVTLQVESV